MQGMKYLRGGSERTREFCRRCPRSSVAPCGGPAELSGPKKGSLEDPKSGAASQYESESSVGVKVDGGQLHINDDSRELGGVGCLGIRYRPQSAPGSHPAPHTANFRQWQRMKAAFCWRMFFLARGLYDGGFCRITWMSSRRSFLPRLLVLTLSDRRY